MALPLDLGLDWGSSPSSSTMTLRQLATFSNLEERRRLMSSMKALVCARSTFWSLSTTWLRLMTSMDRLEMVLSRSRFSAQANSPFAAFFIFMRSSVSRIFVFSSSIIPRYCSWIDSRSASVVRRMVVPQPSLQPTARQGRKAFFSTCCLYFARISSIICFLYFFFSLYFFRYWNIFLFCLLTKNVSTMCSISSDFFCSFFFNEIKPRSIFSRSSAIRPSMPRPPSSKPSIVREKVSALLSRRTVKNELSSLRTCALSERNNSSQAAWSSPLKRSVLVSTDSRYSRERVWLSAFICFMRADSSNTLNFSFSIRYTIQTHQSKQTRRLYPLFGECDRPRPQPRGSLRSCCTQLLHTPFTRSTKVRIELHRRHRTCCAAAAAFCSFSRQLKQAPRSSLAGGRLAEQLLHWTAASARLIILLITALASAAETQSPRAAPWTPPVPPGP